jgi:hypothetical protein
MKKLIVACVLTALAAGSVRADVILGTSNSVDVAPGTASGPVFVTATSNGLPNDMADWQFRLVINPISGSGSVTFQTPGTGTTNPANPTNYIFDSHGVGIVATNSNAGTQLDANDFDNNLGTVVPTAPGANLLELTLHASSNASGLFGVYAVEGSAFTVWDDALSINNPQFFANVPDGSSTVLIGEVTVQGTAAAVPEPATLILLGVGTCTLIGWCYRRRQALPA